MLKQRSIAILLAFSLVFAGLPERAEAGPAKDMARGSAAAVAGSAVGAAGSLYAMGVAFWVIAGIQAAKITAIGVAVPVIGVTVASVAVAAGGFLLARWGWRHFRAGWIARSAIPALKKGRTPEARARAAASLGTVCTEYSHDALRGALQDPDSKVRFEAAEAMARLGHASFAADLDAAASSEPDPNVRAAMSTAGYKVRTQGKTTGVCVR